MFVVCRVSLDKSIPAYMGSICIGGAYFVVTLSTKRFIGCGVNPSLSLPMAVINSDYDNILLYLTAPFIGSLIGVFLYIVLADEFEANSKKELKKYDAEEEALDKEIDNQLIEDQQSNDISERFIEDEQDEVIKEE